MVLDREGIIRVNEYFRLGPARLSDLIAAAERLGSDASAHALAETYHGIFFHTGEDAYAPANALKSEAARFGADAGMFAELVVMSGLEHMREVYRRRGIPEAILADSLKDMTIWMDDYAERNGRTGLAEVGWLVQSLRGDLFRIGRLQFFDRAFDTNHAVAVRRADGMPVVFPAAPERLRGDGQVDGTNGVYDPENGWRSTFRVSDTEIAGTPLHPGGYAVRSEIRLPLGEWELAARSGSNMMDIHIPKDGKMDLDACGESIREGLRFFETYFPEKPVDVIHLHTWFLDAQLQALLPPESNIVRFQREFYLLPVLSTDYTCLERVFGHGDVDIASAPEDTGLRRAVKGFMLAGGRLREGRGIILPRDMGRFGLAQYQTGAARALEALVRTNGSKA